MFKNGIGIKNGITIRTTTENREENKNIPPIPLPLKCLDSMNLSIWLTILQSIGGIKAIRNQLLCI
jgi:hypothetical protein